MRFSEQSSKMTVQQFAQLSENRLCYHFLSIGRFYTQAEAHPILRRKATNRHKHVGCAKSRGKTVRRAQRRSAIPGRCRGQVLRTLSAVPRAVAHPTPELSLT